MHVSKLLTLPNGLYKLSTDRKFLGISLGKKKIFYLNVEQGYNFFTTSQEDYHGFNSSMPCYSFKIKGDKVTACWIHNTFSFRKPHDEGLENFRIEQYIRSATHLEYIKK